MLNKEWADLAKHRLETATEDYNAALVLLDADFFRVANNRAYYSIFNAMRAVLALEGKDFKKHSALISYFMQAYVNTGIFKKEHSKIISRISIIRNSSDYDDFFVTDRKQTQSHIESAKVFYDVVEAYINTELKK